MANHDDSARSNSMSSADPVKPLAREAAPLAADGPDVHRVTDLQAVNEQLLLASLREQVWADELQRQLAFTRAITRSLSEGVVALDQAGYITLVNVAAEQMLGCREAELVGKQIDEALPVQTAHGAQTAWELSRLDDPTHSEAPYQNVAVMMPRRDGSSFSALYSAAPIAINELGVGIVISFRDVTEVHRLRQIQEAYVALLSVQQTMLAEQVQERTSELERTNIVLQVEIREREQSEQTRQQLLTQLVSAQEEERRRIARELHDQMGQNVTAMLLAIKALQDHADDIGEVRQRLATLHVLGNQIGQDVRTLAVQLRPPALDDFGLLPTLTTYIEQWSAQTLIAVEFYSTGLENTRLPHMIETTVFRVVQETLTNIMRHAQAMNVSVIIYCRTNALHVIVEDDGVGFDAQVERGRPYAERRFGLLGMEERVAQLTGSLTIESTPGIGTTVFVSLPLARAA